SGVTGRRSNQLSYARKMTINRRAFVRPPPKPSQAASNDFNPFDNCARKHHPLRGNLAPKLYGINQFCTFRALYTDGALQRGVGFYRIVDK
ncbi:hypothetical protein, partial [Thalassospira sp.]|uniref:hypothetical protein n=1 Tax=Thalassospira sp. TaxID=1912094 RepID=UPI00257CA28A